MISDLTGMAVVSIRKFLSMKAFTRASLACFVFVAGSSVWALPHHRREAGFAGAMGVQGALLRIRRAKPFGLQAVEERRRGSYCGR
ncbi:hypothetical protein MCEMSEM23_02382 [Rhabdaerophilaceae bacterium]